MVQYFQRLLQVLRTRGLSFVTTHVPLVSSQVSPPLARAYKDTAAESIPTLLPVGTMMASSPAYNSFSSDSPSNYDLARTQPRPSAPTPPPAWGEQQGGRFITPYYYSKADLDSHAFRNGLSKEEEAEAVARTTTVLDRVARRLKLPGRTYATTMLLLHRFYAVWPRRSPYYTEEEINVAIVDLACKLQETPVRLPPISIQVLSESRGVRVTDDMAKSTMDQKLAPHQQKILEGIQFDTKIILPFHHLAVFIKQLDDVVFSAMEAFDGTPQEHLHRLCSGLVLDMYRGTLCIRYPSHILAMGALFLSVRLGLVRLHPKIEGDFLEDCGCPSDLVEELAIAVLEAYNTGSPDRLSATMLTAVQGNLESLRSARHAIATAPIANGHREAAVSR
ncbi:uncharacterized protein EV422DRAFT_62864 [Fimicolochytrium jonesii]|uniref:uncharacterized protein n=1 Tax=Fimicolochytrium jonesii TaxID=1396493 RepID=UPI0022FEDF51|nr:uncharacterized protein EV422DRAFT_62864 [Fimicolochytrium jonesii]KAI8820778.1 hypothetical protein EV422DRAFT_62864 [Fimicolochytrium jonesii]